MYRGSSIDLNSCLNITRPQFVVSTDPNAHPAPQQPLRPGQPQIGPRPHVQPAPGQLPAAGFRPAANRSVEEYYEFTQSDCTHTGVDLLCVL